MERLLPLDGLRGLAVFLVLASHASGAGFNVAPGLYASGLGIPGVFLFFVLSSFLLTGQLLDRVDRGESIGWPRFAARRLLRILPAYALSLGALVILGAFTLVDAAQHLVMVRVQGHFWTIPVEVFFYLVLPLLVLILGPIKGSVARAGVLLTGCVAIRWAFPPDFLYSEGAQTPPLAPYLPIFLVGALLAVLRPYWWKLSSDATVDSRALRWFGTIAAAALFGMTPAIWFTATGEPVDHRRFHLHFDLFSALWALVIVAALQERGWIRALASWTPLRRLGQISYSVYLFHMPILGYFIGYGGDWGLPRALIGPLFLAASIAVGAASYFLVERPFLRALRPQTTAPAQP